ncbi:MAG: HIT family protein [Patescibacteria group bacterium]
MDCVFCKIIKGELPSVKVYENHKTVAFLDINPANPGHTLVVPKEHFENLLDGGEEILKEIMLTIKKVAQGITKALDLKGFNVGQNNGAVAGQVVPHLHWHIIPRFENDGLEPWSRKEYKEGEMEEIGEKIKKEIV